MNHFLVFGTHPRLSLAEFKAVKPHLPKPLLIGSAILVEDLEWNSRELMNTLGGTVKLGDIVGSLPADECSADTIYEFFKERLPDHSIDFGWTVYGGSKGKAQSLGKLAIPFKRTLKAHGVSSRWVTGEHGEDISPAAIAKLKMTTEGADICLFPIENKVYIGVSTKVQDADAWSKRDYGRPARDDKNGMLPPKLARMMVNLAQVPQGGTLLDPFCGGGTIGMEAALITNAAQIINSDIESRQVADTILNQSWLIAQSILKPEDANRMRTFQSDVRRIENNIAAESVDRVVTEGYLGPPLHGYENQEDLEKNAATIKKLWEETLRALHPLLKKQGRIVGIWPGFRTAKGKNHVDVEKELAQLGYILESPLGNWEESGGPLVYGRPNQYVTRRIVLLRKA